MRLVFAAALLASALTASAEAATTVLDFNSRHVPSGGTGYVKGDYSEKGFTVMADECDGQNTCFVVPVKTTGSLDPNGAAFATQISPATTTVVKDDGTPFILNSIDMADYYGNWSGYGKDDTIRFTFTFADGTYSYANYTVINTLPSPLTITTLTFNLAPLTAFSFIPLGGAQIQFDNITLSDVPAAPVPEVSTWAMMIGGFGLTGAAMRRRRRTTAIA